MIATRVADFGVEPSATDVRQGMKVCIANAASALAALQGTRVVTRDVSAPGVGHMEQIPVSVHRALLDILIATKNTSVTAQQIAVDTVGATRRQGAVATGML